MAVRQIQILGCDFCGIEAVHDPATTSKGWFHFGSTRGQVYQEVGNGQIDSIGGVFCSVTCLNTYLREILEQRNVNVAPVEP